MCWLRGGETPEESTHASAMVERVCCGCQFASNCTDFMQGCGSENGGVYQARPLPQVGHLLCNCSLCPNLIQKEKVEHFGKAGLCPNIEIFLITIVIISMDLGIILVFVCERSWLSLRLGKFLQVPK